MDRSLTNKAREVLDRCLKGKATAGEICLMESRNIHLEVERGDIDVIKNSQDRLLAVRVLRGHSLGFAYCTDFSPSSLDMLVDQVMNSAASTDEDPHYHFPASRKGTTPVTMDERLSSVPLTEKFKRCQEMERAAYQTDSRIKVARQFSYSETITDVYLVNSHGLEVSYGKSACSTFAMVVAQEGSDAQMAWEMDIQTSYDRLRWDEVGQGAAHKALALLGARSIGTRRAPVIFSPPVGISIMGAFSPAFFADAVQKGRSLMAGRLGQIVASPAVSLVDNGLLEGGLATAPYDGEGVPTQKTVIVDKGRLATYLYDSYTAHKDGVASTGNGVRPGSKSQPQVGATNFYVEKGTCTEDELLADIREGFYVTDVMGAHTINPISGDYSLGATGHWIKGGRREYPVRGVTISGNVLDMLTNISRCADNLRFYGPFGAPTILVSGMIIAGEETGAEG
ncbi:MAG: TldD/PmbA family protein [bacterium]